jgi:hypothetical protein
MREETENLGHLLENVRQLHAGRSDWMGSHSVSTSADNFSDRIGGFNTAAMGSASFGSFIEHYFMKHSGLLVKAVTVKVPVYSRDDELVEKVFVKDNLQKSAFELNSGVIFEYFKRDRLVMFLEVGEGHFHTLVPVNLLRADDPFLQQATSPSRKRAALHQPKNQCASVPEAKKARLAEFSVIEQAAELELLRPSKAKVSNGSFCSFLSFLFTSEKSQSVPA